MSKQEAVIATNDDAATSKLSCVNLGYFKDEFVKFFVRTPTRRAPLINRGYFSRVLALEQLIQSFVSLGGEQLVSLGAGFDTTYFKLKKSKTVVGTYFEVDYPEVVSNKIQIISRHQELKDIISANFAQDVRVDNSELHSTDYHIVTGDLNDIDSISQKLVACGIDFSKPTLFLSECVLIYMTPEAGTKVISWAAKHFPTCVFVTYEQILPDDPFGVTMIKTLKQKGCPLQGIHVYRDIPAQRGRYTSSGWDQAQILDMNEVYDCFLPASEVQRVSRLEIFDELEEWDMIQAHYCIVCATKDSGNPGIWNALVFEESKKNSRKVTRINKFLPPSSSLQK